MKLTFIRPNIGNQKSGDALQPLAIAVLSGLTPPEVEQSFFDGRIEEIPQRIHPDVVALSVETFTARRAYQLAAEFRKKGVHVIMGGYHPTFLPEEALKFADTVVIGEAEGIWERVMEDGLRGRFQQLYRNDSPAALEGIKFDRTLFRNKKYAPIYPVQFGRGCRYSCEFCSVSAFFGNSLRQRPISEVIAEIEASGKRFFFIVDDNLLINPPKTKKFLQTLKPLKIRWATQMSIDAAGDPDLLNLMEKSGCIAVMIGFESLDSRNLAQMGKQVNIKHHEYSLAIRRLRDHGIMIYGSFVFGYDYDTQDSFKVALEFAVENKLLIANFNPLIPNPGTRLYSRLKSEGRLIYDPWWLNPGFKYGSAIFHPRGMTAGELAEGCRRLRFQFGQYSSILRRALDRKANFASLENFGIFWLANLISRAEIHKKQEMILGSKGPVAAPPEDRLEVN